MFAPMLSDLPKEERLLLMKFVCSFAWADLHIQDEERSMVKKLVSKLRLAKEEKEQVEAWLQVPPAAEEVDPAQIPRAHRELFLDTIRKIIGADGEIAPDEAENYALFEALLK